VTGSGARFPRQVKASRVRIPRARLCRFAGGTGSGPAPDEGGGREAPEPVPRAKEVEAHRT
jgi:hypothetical protein